MSKNEFEMSITKRAVLGFGWNQLGKMVEFGLLFLFSIVLARGLGAYKYGIYSTLMSVFSLALLFGSLGFEQAINNYLPKFKARNNKEGSAHFLKVSLFIRIGVLILICSLILSLDKYVGKLINNQEIVPYLKFVSFYVFFFGLSRLLSFVFIGALNLKTPTIVNSLFHFINLLLAYIFLKTGWGIREILFVLISSSAFSFFVYLLKAKEYIFLKSEKIFLNRSSFCLKMVFSFGITLWLIAFLNYLLGRHLDILLLNRFLGDQKTVAYYNVAFTLSSVISALPTMGTAGVGLAVFSEVSAKKEVDSVRRVWQLVFRFHNLLVLPIMFFSVLCAKSIIKVLYGPEFFSSILLLQFFLVFGLGNRLLAGGSNITLLNSRGFHKKVLRLTFLAGILNLVLDVILIPSYETMGAVVATGFSGIFFVTCTFLTVRKLVRPKYPLSSNLKILFSCLVASIGIYWLHPRNLIYLIITGVVFLALYGIVLYFLKPLGTQDKEAVDKIGNPLFSKIVKNFVGK